MLVLQLHVPTIGLGHLDHNMSKRSNEKEKLYTTIVLTLGGHILHISNLNWVKFMFVLKPWMIIFHLKKFYSKIHNGVKDMRKMLLIYQLIHIITVFFEHLLTQTQH